MRTLTGKDILLEDLDTNDTIGSIMQKIEEKEGIPTDNQRIIVNGSLQQSTTPISKILQKMIEVVADEGINAATLFLTPKQ